MFMKGHSMYLYKRKRRKRHWGETPRQYKHSSESNWEGCELCGGGTERRNGCQCRQNSFHLGNVV